MLISILNQNSGEPSSSPTVGAIARGVVFAEKREEWDGGRTGCEKRGSQGRRVVDILNGVGAKMVF